VRAWGIVEQRRSIQDRSAVLAAGRNPMIPDTLREIVSGLHTSANALAALGAALDARTRGAPLSAELDSHVASVVRALGIEGLDDMTPPELQSMLGEIRTFTLTNAKLLFAATRGSGWSHTEREILEAAGDVSVGFPHSLKSTLAPALEGLAERLSQPDAAFLDVGTGTGAMALEMTRVWPSLRVVGIDRSAAALALARERVLAAGRTDRIELPDRGRFDLAWIPGVFVPGGAIASVLERVHRALRPGGWLLFPIMQAAGTDLPAALAGLRIAMFGGTSTTCAAAEQLLRAHGFAEVHALPRPENAVSAMLVGRRPLISDVPESSANARP
jgi:precorrin-6B methylase 2